MPTSGPASESTQGQLQSHGSAPMSMGMGMGTGSIDPYSLTVYDSRLLTARTLRLTLMLHLHAGPGPSDGARSVVPGQAGNTKILASNSTVIGAAASSPATMYINGRPTKARLRGRSGHAMTAVAVDDLPAAIITGGGDNSSGGGSSSMLGGVFGVSDSGPFVIVYGGVLQGQTQGQVQGQGQGSAAAGSPRSSQLLLGDVLLMNVGSGQVHMLYAGGSTAEIGEALSTRV